MSKFQWLLGLHVVAAFLFVSGAIVAGVLQVAAERRERPSEIALLLRLARPAVLAVSAGALAALAFGLWLVGDFAFELSEGWIIGSLVLWAVSAVLGELWGRQARHTREKAEELAGQGDQPSGELRRMLSAPAARFANYASLAAALAILGLMVWKPGA